MPKINVEKPFRLRKNNGEVVDFEPGEQTVDKETADHWFVKAHLFGASFEPKEGSYEYAQRNRALKSEEDQVIADQAAADADQAKAEADARAAELMAKTEQAITAVAQQAQDAVTKNDPQTETAVTDLPAIPLNPASVAGDAQSSSTDNSGDQQTTAGTEPVTDGTAEASGQTGEQKAE